MMMMISIKVSHSIDCRRQQQLQSQPQNKRNSLNTERFSDDSVDYYDGSNTRNNNVNDENLSEEIDEEFDDFVCPEKFGYYPDVKNCSKYHQCDHGKSRLKSCDDGLVFSTILKTCDWPYNVNCNQANGDRGDYLGKHLRLRNGELLDDNLDPSNTNRRQPVLMDEADDSYWLGRPNTDLLAFLNDDNLNNDYNNGPEEFNDFDIPRRPVVVKPQTTSSSPRSNNNVDDDNNNNKNNRRQHSTNANNKNDDNEPWFQNFNYNQRRPATLSANQRGNNQRHHSSAPNQHHRHHTTITTTTTTTSSPTILPRKALRVGDNFNNDDYLYTDDGELHHQPNHNDLGYDYRRKSNKNDRDSYRIVSFNHHQHQQQNPTTFAPTTTTPTPTIATTRSQPVWFQQTTPTPIPSIETTINSAARIGSRPRHLGTSFRRKVLRKKIVSQTAATTPRPTTPAQVFGNFYNNDNNNNKNNNDPWKSFRYETVNRQPVTPIPPTVGPKHLSTIRRGIPTVQDPKQRPRFERKPVLRDESEDANERINDDDYEINNNNNEDDIAVRNLIYNNKQQEIVRKNSTISPLSHHNDDNLLLLPKNTVKDVSNNIGVRFRAVNQKPSIINQPITPKTITTTAISTTTHRNRNNNNNNRNKELNNVFDAGFRHAISPPTSTINHSSLRHQPPPPPSSDIEYEDIENEDEDEDFDIDDNNANDNDDNNNNDRSLLLNNQSLNNNNNKEIVVRYDDDTDDNDNNNNNNNQFQHHPSVTSRRQQFNQHAPPNRFAINNSTNNRFVNNVNADPYNHFPRSSPSLNSSAILS